MCDQIANDTQTYVQDLFQNKCILTLTNDAYNEQSGRPEFSIQRRRLCSNGLREENSNITFQFATTSVLCFQTRTIFIFVMDIVFLEDCTHLHLHLCTFPISSFIFEILSETSIDNSKIEGNRNGVSAIFRFPLSLKIAIQDFFKNLFWKIIRNAKT